MTVRVRIVVLATTALLFAAAACSTFSSDDTPPGGGDADVVDAGGDATTDTSKIVEPPFDAGPDALIAEGFEVDNGGCGVWVGTTALVDRVADAGHSGSFACRFCAQLGDGGGYFGLGTIVADPGQGAAQSYFIEAYVRQESGGPTNVAAAFIVAGNLQEGAEAPAPGWTHVSHRFFADAGLPVHARIEGNASTSAACILVDDIIVRKVTP